MKRFFLIAAFAMLTASATAKFGGFSVNGPPTIAKNIVTDFGATCNGVADDASAFAAFNAWAQGQTLQIILTIPSGSTCLFLSSVGISWAKGIQRLVVMGYGATISDNNGTGSGFTLGGSGVQNAIVGGNKTSSRLATVSAGSSSVTPLNTSEATLFTVGQWALITGYDLQGLWQNPFGYPPNPHFFEYVQITAINVATGQITFSAPLKNTYKSTWPNYNSGNVLQADAGGPATLYALDPSWNTEVEYRGLTIARPTAQTYANGRSVTYKDVTFTGTACGVPTQNLVWQAINTNMSTCSMEADKLVGTIVLNGVTISQLAFQSSSIDLLNMSNSSVTVSLNGTPKKAVILNSTIAVLKPGAFAYGRSDEIICTNCVISSIIPGGVLEKGPSEAGINVGYTMSGGVITVPNTDGAIRWAVPGTNLFWSGFYQTELSFRVVGVTQDANNTYVQTTLFGGFPSVPQDSGKLYIQVHPAPKFTCTNCTGSVDAVDLSQAPAGAPLYSYSKRTYTGAAVGTPGTPGYIFPLGTASASTPTLIWWGALSSLKFNVTTAYTGAHGTLTLHGMAVFDNYPTITAAGSVFTYGPDINLNTIGQRLITPSGVTGTQSGDSGLPVPEAVWLTQAAGIGASTDISGEASNVWPTVTIEITTNQGVVNP